MTMIVISFMEDPRTGAISQRVVVPKEGMMMGVAIRTPYLASAGQLVQFGVTAHVLAESKPKPLQDARPFISNGIEAEVKHRRIIRVEGEWWRLPHCLVPTNRALWQVLMDAVQHGVDKPTHGADCSCMDSIIWELRRHIDRALPEVERTVEHDPHAPEDPTIRYDPRQWEANMAARQRVHVVLQRLARDI